MAPYGRTDERGQKNIPPPSAGEIKALIYYSLIIHQISFSPCWRGCGWAMLMDNFQCWSVLLIWIKVGQVPADLARTFVLFCLGNGFQRPVSKKS